MERTIQLRPIGLVQTNGHEFSVQINPEFIPALQRLDDFGYANLYWWCHESDQTDLRKLTVERKPYTKGPETVGIFATRSPRRPNPIAVSPVMLLDIDHRHGIITIPWVDALHTSPVIDIKPYTPSLDRVRQAKTPAWCDHWPKWHEDSASFDWEAEFENAE
ncbi:MAG: TrmO family methyltransferase [Leptospirales bacterium]